LGPLVNHMLYKYISGQSEWSVGLTKAKRSIPSRFSTPSTRRVWPMTKFGTAIGPTIYWSFSFNHI
jgi:hypothetical protein